MLISKALEKGAKMMNRVMVFNLFRDGNDAVGAMGIHTREDKIVIFKAKSIILGTGAVDRLYPPPTPGWLTSMPNWPTLTGDGRAMAYRAGVALASIEVLRRHA